MQSQEMKPRLEEALQNEKDFEFERSASAGNRHVDYKI
jgi:hypothetical protein